MSRQSMLPRLPREVASLYLCAYRRGWDRYSVTALIAETTLYILRAIFNRTHINSHNPTCGIWGTLEGCLGVTVQGSRLTGGLVRGKDSLSGNQP